ncbi:MAG TPA: helix-turn-helix domain-containing protein [Solirubrobacterales bacterium]
MAAGTKRGGLKTALQAAVGHPLRLRIFAILAERPASPAELSREFAEAVGNVNYHVQALASANLIEEVGSRPVRGAVEHFFKAVELPYISDEQEAELDDCARHSMTETVVAIYAANATHALKSGTLLSRNDHHLTRTALNVDEAGWGEVTAAYADLYDRVIEIQTAAAERMGQSDEEPIRILSFQSLFELPPAAA